MGNCKIIVQIGNQRAMLYRDGEIVRAYAVSTAANGTGSEPGSHKTPLGKFRIHKKIGHGLPSGSVLRSRVPTGELCAGESAEDLILSRILWLEGCQPENANTRDRYIYLHGTNQEHLIGKPASHGCVRLGNKDVMELFELVEEGTEVEILE